MNRFLHGRLAIILSFASAAGLGFENISAAAQPPVRMAQRTYGMDSQPIGTTDGPIPRYNCEPRRDASETIANCKGVKESHDNGIWKILVAIVIAAVIAAIVKKTVFSSSGDSLTEQKLLDDGPQLPVSYPDGTLSVQGFARDGWPIVVDLQPQPNTVTELRVTIGNGRRARTQMIVLDPDGSRGRQIVKVEMPRTGAARDPTPATYSITSIPIAAFDSEQPRLSDPTPVQIFGIGGGPRAVGSVAIEQVAFTAAIPGARFRYVAKSEFHRARAQVQQLQRDGKTIRIRPVFDVVQSNLSVGPQVGSWSGAAAGSASPSHGLHRLQVTGWFTTDDRSWVAALAPDLITQ